MDNKPAIHLSTLTIIIISVGIAVAIAACTAFFSVSYNHSLLQYAYTSSEQSVKQTSVAVENYVEELKDKLTRISAEMRESGSAEDFTEKISMAAKLENDITTVMVYDLKGNLLSCGSKGGHLKDHPYRNLSFNEALYSSGQDFTITAPHVQTIFENEYPWVVTIARREHQPLFGGEVIIAIDFRFSEIAKYIDKVGIGQRGYCYVINSMGKIIYHPQQQMVFSGLKDEDLGVVAAMSDGLNRQGNNIYTLQSLESCSWRVVGVSYNDEIAQNVQNQVILGVLVSILLCAVIAVVISQLFYRAVTKPVRRLVKAMQAFERQADDYKYSAHAGNIAELQTLSDSFGHMVSMIQYLLEKVHNEELTLRKTELKALQAQINPHFLYNTLDSIQWMCEQGKNEDAVEMVGALARLFRISISHGNELITIRDELRHAESYLIIQSFRYKNQFSYEFHVDESVADCLCNKITIQPFIENAIYHGLDRMVDPGKIDISVFPDEEDILITVADNGVGMTEEQCRKVLQKDRSDSRGIGVKNVNDRLKIYFGDRYGIAIESELDVGTTVTIRIPRLRKEQGNEM